MVWPLPLAGVRVGRTGLNRGSNDSCLWMYGFLYRQIIVLFALRKVYLMTIKTTVNIDEDVWEEFKKAVSTRYGSTRNLSGAVEHAINNYNTVRLLRRSAKTLELPPAEYPSSSEVEERRPEVAVDSSSVLREMRDDRKTRILGQ